MSSLNDHTERWRTHRTPTDKRGHWVGDVFHHGVNDPDACDRCQVSVDYTRPGFVRPADPEPCPNDHGPDNVIACWSPGGPCPVPNDPACETCGPCFHCTDRDPFGGPDAA